MKKAWPKLIIFLNFYENTETSCGKSIVFFFPWKHRYSIYKDIKTFQTQEKETRGIILHGDGIGLQIPIKFFKLKTINKCHIEFPFPVVYCLLQLTCMHNFLLLHIRDQLMVFVVGKISNVLDVCNITTSCILGRLFPDLYNLITCQKKKKKKGPDHVVNILQFQDHVLTSLVQATWSLVVCVLHLTLILMTKS